MTYLYGVCKRSSTTIPILLKTLVYSNFRRSIVELGEVKWWDAKEHSSSSGGTVSLYFIKHESSNRESDSRINNNCIRNECPHVLETFIKQNIICKIVKYPSKVRSTVLRIKESFNIEEKETFYWPLNAVEVGFSKSDIEIMMGDLNSKMGSDNTSIGF